MKRKTNGNGYRTIIEDSGTEPMNRLLVGTACTGLVRVEWVQARHGQIIPTNWSMVTLVQFMNSYMPLRYQVDDAQNLIVKAVIEKDFEWLLLIEHDVLLPPDAFVRFNEYIRKAEAPVVSGLYFTRSIPSEPLLYRGRGTSYYDRWKNGDKVWVDGVPTGALLVHGKLLKAMWKESESYMVNGQIPARKVFETPRRMWIDPEHGGFNTTVGTSDLDWCTKVMKGKFLEKAGWPKHQKMKNPFLVDTNIFCKHINMDGGQFPPEVRT